MFSTFAHAIAERDPRKLIGRKLLQSWETTYVLLPYEVRFKELTSYFIIVYLLRYTDLDLDNLISRLSNLYSDCAIVSNRIT